MQWMIGAGCVRFMVAVCGMLALASAQAATVTWSGATGGDWNTGSNWGGSKPASGDTALFNTTLGSVVNAVADQTVNSISFDTSAGTASGTFTLGTTGGNKLIVGNSYPQAIQILSTLAGSGKTISVNAPISLTGGYYVNNLSADSSNTLKLGGAISSSVAGTVGLSLYAANTGSNTISGAISMGSATTFNVTKTGVGTWFLSGANSYNGNTLISGGILQVNAGAGGSLSSSSALEFDTGNGAFILDNTGAGGAINQSLVCGSAMTGGEGVYQINRVAAQNLTLTLSATPNPINWATVNYVTSGTPGVNGTDSKIVITGLAPQGFSGQNYFNGGNFVWYDAAGYVRGINYGTDAGSATSAGTTSIASPVTYQQVTGAVTAQNTATFTRLLINGANDFTLAAGQTVTVTSLLKSGGGASTISGGNGITLGSTQHTYLRVASASDSLTISNAIAGSGRFVMSGKGTLILSASNTYSGDLLVNDGVVNIQNANALGTTAGYTSVGGALQIQGGITVTGETLYPGGMGMNNDGALRNISGNNTWAGPVGVSSGRINSDSGTLTITGNMDLYGSGVTFGGAGTVSVSGIIKNAGPKVFKDGSGTLTLSGVNTWVSGFTIQDGVVSIATFNNASTPGPLGNYGGSIIMGGTATVGTISYTGATGSSTMKFTMNAGGGNFEVTNAATALTLSGNIDGSGGLTKSGSGTLILSGYNQYGGSTTINGGTLQIAALVNRIGSSPQLALNGGALYTVGAGSLLTLGSGSGVALGSGGGTFRTDTATPLTIQGVVSGSGSLTKTDTGLLTLSGANTFSGATTVSAGTLAIGNNLALQNSALDTTGAGVITITGFTTPTFGGLKGGANLASVITTGYGSITAITLNPAAGVSNTYSGAIANGAAGMTLTKSGSGTQVLSGTNTYTGATTVSNGTLLVDGATTNSTVTVVSNAILGGTGFLGSGTVNAGGVLSANGTNTIGTLSVTNLTLAENAVIYWNYDAAGPSADLINVTGALTLPTNATVYVSGTGTVPSSGQMFSANSLSGASTLRGWTITGPGAKPTTRAVRSGNNVSLVTSSGMVITLQ
jgi:autotransporter-associated beta strand protein